MKRLYLIFLLLFITSCTYLEDIKKDITGEVIYEKIPVEEGSASVYFCPRDNCEEKLISLVESSEKIHCALYELNLEKLIDKLKEKNAIIVVDDKNYDEFNYSNLHKDDREALMHNKFCIFDDKIISTGSFNPTVNGNTKNNNNLIIVSSQTLAKNYEDEFQGFLRDEFGRDITVENPKVILNNEILIENYFCPEDNCEQHIYDVLKKAKQRIYFMTFSFTSDKLGDLIIEKSNEVEVKGIFENFQSSTEYSELNKMKKLKVITDKNPNFMHHKVFIIDDIVVSGSYNPTSSGNSKNDENILIIYDKEVAEKFLEEFDYVWSL
jgi:phosphatidylserine/phosphatidylglycerophosphate/cardiolipin synthase-like enzyme